LQGDLEVDRKRKRRGKNSLNSFEPNDFGTPEKGKMTI